MAASQPPARPWLRVPSIARPAAAPTPAPAPAPAPQAQVQPPAPQTRPPFVRPPFPQTFRPQTQPQPQPTQPQEIPPPPVATAPPATALPPLSAASPPPAIAPPPPSLPPVAPPTIATATSVRTSPIIRPSTTSAPLPTPPAPKASPFYPRVLPFSSSSLPSSSAPTSSGPVISTYSVPPSPKLKDSAPASSLPTSPASKIVSSYPAPPPPSSVPATLTAARMPNPTFPVKIDQPPVNTPPPSPKIKHVSTPPSPLTLPPAQIKFDAEREPKTPTEVQQKLVVKESIEKPKVTARTSNGDFPRSTDWKGDVRKDVESKDKGTSNKFSDPGELGMSVITIAGENKGAIMKLSPSNKKHGIGGNPQTLHKRDNPKDFRDGKKWGGDISSSSSDERRSKMKDKSNKATSPMGAFLNSNVQGVNNSIVYDSSCTHHDPGVHLSLSRKASGGRGIHIKE